jgi:hypothetical protein
MTSRLEDGVYEGRAEWGMVREDITAILAGGFPVKPPKVWFNNPSFMRLSPLTIEGSGQVLGHIASWRQSHIGMSGSVRAPKSKSKYAFFKTGVVEADDGTFQDVGQITLTGGHAPLDATTADAVAHYDNTDSAVMDVNVGEDRFGIWVAGALRPDVSESRLRSIRASSVSGDWRPINGGLELVAVCAVNVPGIPIPRAKIASGVPVALVAAGVEPLVDLALEENLGLSIDEQIRTGLTEVYDRLEAIESRPDITMTAAERREAVSEAIASVSTDREAHIESLRRNVHKDAVAASLRSRVHA